MANTEESKKPQLVQAYQLLPVNPVGDAGDLAYVSATRPESPNQPFQRVLIDSTVDDIVWAVYDNTGGTVPKTALIYKFTDEQWEAAINFAHFHARRIIQAMREARGRRDFDSY